MRDGRRLLLDIEFSVDKYRFVRMVFSTTRRVSEGMPGKKSLISKPVDPS